jgi:hypothetical protein
MNANFDQLTNSLAPSITRRAARKKYGLGLAGMKLAALGLAGSLLSVSCLLPGGARAAAISFDGTGGYVSIATTGSLSGTFTVELWAKPNDDTPNAALCLLGSRRPVDFSFDFIFWQGNLLHGDIGNNFTWITTAANAPLPYSTNTWYHLAEVATPTNYTIYVDGSALATASFSPDSPLLYNDSHQLVIGNFGIDLPGYVGDEYMNGLIDEVRIWNTARTASELQTNAFRTLTGSEPGLMGYWPLDEGSGSTTDDASGHGFIGTLVPSLTSGPAWVDSNFKDEKKPTIISQPQAPTVLAGADLNLSVVVFGGDPLSYQWRFNSNNLPGATNATLTLRSVTPSASGQYSVIVTNHAGSVLSEPALVTVIAPRLQIGLSGDLLFIWWPARSSGFALESSASVGAVQSWSRFSGFPLVIGDQNVVAVNGNSGRRFFRLHQQ